MTKSQNKTAAVILAAGKGVRMKSDLPKVLHPILDKPMVWYVARACRQAGIRRIILVIGHQSDLVRLTLGPEYEYVEQSQQLGTGHALMMAAETLKNYRGDLLVLAGDTPLLTGQILQKLIKAHQKKRAAATLMTANLDPTPAYGRIIRDSSGRIRRIVEERDATRAEKKITEVNTSHYCFHATDVFPLLKQLGAENDQGEYYLTDVIQLLADDGKDVQSLSSDDPSILVGINSRQNLSDASALLRERIARRMMDSGVTIVDPASVFIGPEVKMGRDTTVHPCSSVFGRTKIGKRCVIGPQVKLRDIQMGDDCKVEFSMIEGRKIESGSILGPFAYIE